jgi:hypothetical protein
MGRKNYTISTAKSMITRNGGKIEGKQIIIKQPGIKLLGAIDFLKSVGYGYHVVLPAEKPVKRPRTFAQAQKMATESFLKLAKLMGGKE